MVFDGELRMGDVFDGQSEIVLAPIDARSMTVSVETLPAGSEATLERTVEDGAINLAFGIPQGEPGEPGAGLPPGGTDGQYLVRRVGAEAGAVWRDLPIFDGSYEVTPLPYMETIMQTQRTYLDRDIVVKEIPYAEVTNEKGGLTATIGG